MKKTIPMLVLGSLTLASCESQSETNKPAQTTCLERNLFDVTDIVDAADNDECEFIYDESYFQIDCPSSGIQGTFHDAFYTVFHDENNSLYLMGEDLSLRCDQNKYEISSQNSLEEIQENLRSKFSFLPIPD